MKKTKLIKILAKFDNSELRKLKDLVNSPFFNKNEKIKLLFDFLINFAPDFKRDDLTENNAFDYVFKGDEYKHQAITKLSSKLFKLVSKFIHLEKDSESSFSADLHLLSFFREKELIHEYTQHLNSIKKGIDSSKMRDANFFYEQFLVEQELSLLEVFKGNQGTGDFNYQPAVDALDKYYLVQKLIYLCNQHNGQRAAPRQMYHFELMEELEAYIPQSPYFNILIIRIWFTTLQLIKSSDKKAHYTQLKALVFEHHNELNSVDIRNILATIQNNARLIFENKEDYYNELFNLYSFQLDRGILDDPELLTPQIFFNIFSIAILLNKLTWVAKFLDRHQDYALHREDDVHSLGRATLAFAKRNYSEALDYLNTCNLKNIYFKLGERRLRLKIYYELEIFELIDDTVNSFRKFLSKNKESISDLHLNANRDFVNLTNHVFFLQKNDKHKIRNLETEIKKTPLLPEKRWLIEKIAAF